MPTIAIPESVGSAGLNSKIVSKYQKLPSITLVVHISVHT